jgi:hypothetical protein
MTIVEVSHLTNTLAYYDMELIKALKSLKVQAYVHELLN